MAEDFAERFAFEPSRVVGIVKALRDEGLIKTGPRGVNAHEATPTDAARILIAMMLRVRHQDAAEAVRLFGQMQTLKQEPVSIGGRKAESFEAALATLLSYCMRPISNSDEAWSYFGRFDFSASIVRWYCHGRITLQRFADEDDDGNELEDTDESGIAETREFLFLHPAVHDFDPESGKPTIEPSYFDDVRRYRAGFHEVPHLLREDIIAIGQVLAGHRPLGWICRQYGEFEDQ